MLKTKELNSRLESFLQWPFTDALIIILVHFSTHHTSYSPKQYLKVAEVIRHADVDIFKDLIAMLCRAIGCWDTASTARVSIRRELIACRNRGDRSGCRCHLMTVSVNCHSLQKDTSWANRTWCRSPAVSGSGRRPSQSAGTGTHVWTSATQIN